MGWLVVFFDLPTLTPTDRKNYTQFRKDLLNDGYIMIQFSVYARPCVTYDRILTHQRRLRSFLPPDGLVRCIFVTNIQWHNAISFYGLSPPNDKPPDIIPEQLLLW